MHTLEEAAHRFATRKLRQNRARRVALAEDDADTRAMIAETLRDGGCEVAELSGGTALVDHLGRLLAHGDATMPDLIVADMAMPEGSGLDVLAWLRTLERSPPCVIVTGYSTDEVRLVAAELGAAAVLEKPIDLEAFDRLVHRLTDVD